MSWELHLYISPGGQPVVGKFIRGLLSPTRSKVSRLLDLLEEYGTDLGMPHAKAMGDGLIELRARGKQEVRVFYAFAYGRKIYLLHGFVKKSQTTPRKELEIARQRKDEIK
jgi:phage-related protein